MGIKKKKEKKELKWPEEFFYLSNNKPCGYYYSISEPNKVRAPLCFINNPIGEFSICEQIHFKIIYLKNKKILVECTYSEWENIVRTGKTYTLCTDWYISENGVITLKGNSISPKRLGSILYRNPSRSYHVN